MSSVGGMNILLVQPSYPVTYWGFQHALPIAGRKVCLPPLGLVTVAALLPRSWAQRLVDLNGRDLDDADLLWADVVLTGGMRVQAPSMQEVVRRAHRCGRPVMVGGPAVSSDPELIGEADVAFVGEAEGRADELVAAIEAMADGRRAEAGAKARLLPEGGYPSMDEALVPRFDLLDMGAYMSMAVQFSRGCPFGCEFCDVVAIFGHRSRVKPAARLLAELDALYESGYRGTLFFVDDNFIGNRKEVRLLLATLIEWQKDRGHPFEIYTEASVDLAADDALLDEMVAAGFSAVFLGIETPSKGALEEAGKRQNLRVDLADAVNRITARGIEVTGGFTVAMRIALWGGVLISAPFLVFFIGQFIFPGLTSTEQTAVRRASGFSVGLFIIGVLLGYFGTLPVALNMMFQLHDWLGIQPVPQVNSYVAFTVHLLLAFGIAFQMPVILVILGKLGLLTSTQLRERRRYVIVILLVVAMVLTPPDIFTQLIMALPLVALYEGCIWIVYLTERQRAD